METLTPFQRVLVIAIGLILTALIAALVLPWLSQQIQERSQPAANPDPASSMPSTPNYRATANSIRRPISARAAMSMAVQPTPGSGAHRHSL
jgi:hypothetical protein